MTGLGKTTKELNYKGATAVIRKGVSKIKCDHRYERSPTNMFNLCVFSCVKCMKWFYGAQGTAKRLERKCKLYSCKDEWDKSMEAFQKDPVMNLQPQIIIDTTTMEDMFWA